MSGLMEASAAELGMMPWCGQASKMEILCWPTGDDLAVKAVWCSNGRGQLTEIDQAMNEMESSGDDLTTVLFA